MPRLLVTFVSAAVTVVVVVTAYWTVRGSQRTGAAEPPQNVVLVTWDGVRADRLPLYGGPRPTTPWLSEAAARAVLFDRAYTPSTSTTEAYAALFTGSPETSRDRPGALADRLKRHGYRTAALTTNPALADGTLLRGFDLVWSCLDPAHRASVEAACEAKDIPGDRSQELSEEWAATSGQPAPDATWPGRFKDASPVVVDELLRWIDDPSRPASPFFAFVNLADAVPPWRPTKESRQAVIGDPTLITRGLATDLSQARRRRADVDDPPYAPAEAEALAAVYDATLHDLDQVTAALEAGLRDRNLLDTTLIIVTSDHGAPLGTHGLYDHHHAPWEPIVRVPLIVWHPGWSPERRSDPVSTRDVFSMILQLVSDDVPDPAPVVTDLPASEAPEPLQERLRNGRVWVSDRYKLVESTDGRQEIYDLTTDPGERSPVDDPELARTLKGAR